MFEDRTFEKGIFSGLALAIIGSVLLPGLQILAAAAGTVLAAFIVASNRNEGVLTGFTMGFTIVFLGLVNLFSQAGLPVTGIMKSAIGFSPFKTTVALFVTGSLIVLAVTTITGALTGFMKYEEDFEYATA